MLRLLCQALATLCVQMASWQGCVKDLMTNYGHSEATIPLLLEVLHVLPEEANASRVCVHPERRQRFLQELTDARQQVAAYLEQVYQNATAKADASTQEKVMSCLFGWLRYDIMVARELTQSVLLTAPFEALGGGYKLFDVAKDVICELLRSSEDVQRDTAVVQILVPRVMSLAPAYDQAVAKQDEGNNEEIVRGLCYIFSELAESYLELLLQATPDTMQFVQLLCKCAANAEAEVARRTFDFWYRLMKAICDRDGRYNRSEQEVARRLHALPLPVSPHPPSLPVSDRTTKGSLHAVLHYRVRSRSAATPMPRGFR